MRATLIFCLLPGFLFAQSYFEASGQTVAFYLTAGAKAGWNSSVAIEHNSGVFPTVPAMSVFPNPSHAEVTIAVQGQADGAQVSIFNVAGKKVRSLDFSRKATALVSTGLGNGLYFARLRVQGRTVQTIRFLVVR